jgi:hypothetical protein
MATILNIPDCGGTTGTFNSGIPLCDKIRGNFYGLIGLDAGVGFSNAETATAAAFLTALTTKTRAARGDRAYPLFGIWSNFEDQRKERTQGSAGNLTNVDITLVDGLPAFALQHRKGDIMHSKLITAQNAGMTWLVVDDKYTVYGTYSASQFTGFSTADVYAGLPFFGNNGQPSYYPFELKFGSITEWKENARFLQMGSTLVGVTGLRNVTLEQFSFATNVLKLSLTAEGGTNVATTFDTELAQATAITVVNKTSGSACTTSVAYDATNKVMAITLSGTPFTGAASGDKFTVNLASAATLAALAAPIDGYESTGSIEVSKP